MTKKLTKKELAALEEIKRQKRSDRELLVSSVRGYWEDVKATVRYYNLHNMTDKVYRDDLREESEKQQLLENYEILKDNNYKVSYEKEEFNPWSTIRWIVKNERKSYLYDDYKLEYPLFKDAFYIDDFWWTTKDIEGSVKMLLQYGYTTIHLFDNSTAVMRNLVDLINLGCKVVGTNKVLRKTWCDKDEYVVDKEGLIIELPQEVE